VAEIATWASSSPSSSAAGNIFRGVKASAVGMDRAQADYMGMLATVINALALQDASRQEGVHSRVVTAIENARGGRTVHPAPRVRHLEKGRVVVFGPARATRTSPRTPPPRCARWRSRPR